LSQEAAEAILTNWDCRARANQLPPPGNWRTWLLLAGRGFGKTRTGSEWVKSQIEVQGRRRIALAAPTSADARDIMIEGESGLLAVFPESDRPLYEPSKRRVTWKNGAIATAYSADEPERLRGPQHDAAWCDECASWRYPEAFDMLMFGLRLGSDPRVVVTTTPKPVKIIRELLADPTTTLRAVGYARLASSFMTLARFGRAGGAGYSDDL
jgi:phage terminase large subunit-like protein